MFNSGGRLWLDGEEDRVRVCHRYLGPIEVGHTHANHYLLMIIINVVRQAAGEAWHADEIYLATGCCRWLEDDERLGGARIIFKHSFTAVSLPRALLSLPLPRERQWVGDYLEEYDGQFVFSAPALDLGGSVQQAVAVILPRGYPAIAAVAELAGMSARSLQRHLAAQGLSYARLVERARFDVAVRLLANSKAKLIDIAHELGYADPANFSRAFKRWTGVSPQTFRSAAERGDHQYARK
jgi:AraC-like DNA-binding protein